MTVPDPSASRAVLVGVNAYTHPDLAPLPAAAAAAKRLATLLQDPTVWGLPDDHVAVLDANISAEDILGAVRDAARATTGTLVVYFAGHGLRDRDERLYLALPDADADHPQIGTLSYLTLRDVMRQAGYRARYRLLVLDCCYSGLAGGMDASTVPSRSDLARALNEPHIPAHDADGDADDYGNLVLTSAPPTQRSFVQPGADYPEFTGELINVLNEGIPGAGPSLSMDRVWRRIRARLREQGSPEPQQFAQNTVARQIRFHNRAAAKTARPPGPASAMADPPTETRPHKPTARQAIPPSQPSAPERAEPTHQPETPRTRKGVRRRTLVLGMLAVAGPGVGAGVKLWPKFTTETSGTKKLTGSGTAEVAFSPDGKTLVRIGSDSQLRDAATGESIADLPSDQNSIESVAFSPDGKIFATGGYSDVRLRDSVTGVTVTELSAPRQFDIRPVAFSPDSKMLACGGAKAGMVDDSGNAEDRKDAFRLLDVTTGNVIATSAEHDVQAVAFSPDGKTVACANDHGCWLWDVADQRFTALPVSEWTHAVAFISHSKLMTSGSGGSRLWDTTTRRIIATLATGETYTMAVTSDSRTLATGGPDGVRLWDLATRRTTGTLTGNTTHSLAFSPDGRTLAGATSEESSKNTHFGVPYDDGCWLWKVS
ncbi:caspase, EACC1-associated type [Streptomyces sp. BE133]|uniref:caspase, EACC1-associated type n=1 Tax=Streptomyces sp. BE133 TaxID=3002523 RepID=UPI002E7A3720|nr:caspase family protein [Streptomyces sp. BE133]MEE1805286.1 caspase family protein [Streptomyces sp. BE133]